MYKKNNILLLFVLVCIVLGMFVPLTSMQFTDGHTLLESSVSEDLLLLPVLLTISGLLLLLTKFHSHTIANPQLCCSLLVPPPIQN
jgi:hypothetical protein